MTHSNSANQKTAAIPHWHCVAGCGACCYLQPSERPQLDSYLSPSELQTYFSLVGPDGWCINYDKQQRKCQIYETRPEFCRVTVSNFNRMFGLEPDEFPEFAANCCREHIADIYGNDSDEMHRFDEAVPI